MWTYYKTLKNYWEENSKSKKLMIIKKRSRWVENKSAKLERVWIASLPWLISKFHPKCRLWLIWLFYQILFSFFRLLLVLLISFLLLPLIHLSANSPFFSPFNYIIFYYIIYIIIINLIFRSKIKFKWKKRWQIIHTRILSK